MSQHGEALTLRPMLVSSHFVMRLRGTLLERGLPGRAAQLLLTLDEAEGGRAAPGGTAARGCCWAGPAGFRMASSLAIRTSMALQSSSRMRSCRRACCSFGLSLQRPDTQAMLLVPEPAACWPSRGCWLPVEGGTCLRPLSKSMCPGNTCCRGMLSWTRGAAGEGP